MSSSEEEDPQYEPWLQGLLADDRPTAARVTFYDEEAKDTDEHGWLRVRAVEIPNPFDVAHGAKEPRRMTLRRNSKVLCAVEPNTPPYIALIRRIWKNPKEEPLPPHLKNNDPAVYNLLDFRLEVLWFYRVSEATAPQYIGPDDRVAKEALWGAKFNRSREQGSERQLLFSSHCSKFDDEENDSPREEAGIAVESVLRQCEVVFLDEHADQPVVAFINEAGEYLEKRLEAFVVRFFHHHPHRRCYAVSDCKTAWTDNEYFTHKLAEKFLEEDRARMEALRQKNEEVRAQYAAVNPERAAALRAVNWRVQQRPPPAPKQEQQQQQQQGPRKQKVKPALRGASSSKQPPGSATTSGSLTGKQTSAAAAARTPPSAGGKGTSAEGPGGGDTRPRASGARVCPRSPQLPGISEDGGAAEAGAAQGDSSDDEELPLVPAGRKRVP